jgi:hypothetical protein
MARDEDTAIGKVEASVTLVIRRVSKKDIEGRPRGQLMGSGGGGVRVTRTPEDSKIVVSGRCTEKNVVRCGSRADSRRKMVKEIGGCVQALSPEASGKGCLEQKDAHGVIGCAYHALCLAVLGGGIRTRHVQLDTVRRERRHVRLSYRTHRHCRTGQP